MSSAWRGVRPCSRRLCCSLLLDPRPPVCVSDAGRSRSVDSAAPPSCAPAPSPRAREQLSSHLQLGFSLLWLSMFLVSVEMTPFSA
eukprot:1283863-Pleurochrysis_carterae.AAC.1